jgi:hypothetical protein
MCGERGGGAGCLSYRLLCIGVLQGYFVVCLYCFKTFNHGSVVYEYDDRESEPEPGQDDDVFDFHYGWYPYQGLFQKETDFSEQTP